MKLILTHEVTGLGAPGDIVEVKDGYGRNFLIPRGFAIRWTRGGEKQIDSIKNARSARAVHDLDKAKQIKATLEGSAVDVPVRAGEGGRLFGAVTVSDIADAINKPGRRRVRRQAQGHGRQPDQVAGRAPGHRQGARRARGHRQAERRTRLSAARSARPHHSEPPPVTGGGSAASARVASVTAGTDPLSGGPRTPAPR